MKRVMAIIASFLDIDGVLLIKGRDHHARKWAATHFKLQWALMEGRHHPNFAVYAEGTLTMDDYREQISNPSARHWLNSDGSVTKESSLKPVCLSSSAIMAGRRALSSRYIRLAPSWSQGPIGNRPVATASMNWSRWLIRYKSYWYSLKRCWLTAGQEHPFVLGLRALE